MANLDNLNQQISELCGQWVQSSKFEFGELSIETQPSDLIDLMTLLRDNPALSFEQLVDVCAVDYLNYAVVEWETETATLDGFSRGVETQPHKEQQRPRFAVVYHLLSISNNWRLRVFVNCDESNMIVPSLTKIWKSANWFEREAYDLYGVLFSDHPDLRRILTDYGFIGHPFRKDFPVSGNVEMRYDATLKRVIYEPVSIEPRILVPKVIRDDNRYQADTEGQA
jgi:NADH-quinone oxidoreductase subunit C